ncbi:MAG: glycerophosphodiester phosphodiesterase [Nanoarchaeota archaeon]
MVSVMAHRGASSIAPENTILAFKKAIEHGAHYIELDVRMCKTGELVVMHDSKVNRTTSGKGYIARKTLAELKKLNLKRKQKIPTLEEAIVTVKGKCKLNIEIKSPKFNQKYIDTLIKLLEKHNFEDQVVISSYNHKMLKHIKEQKPSIETAALFIEKKSPSLIVRRLYYIGTFIRKTKRVKADALNLPHQFITKRTVKSAINEGLKVNAWTVNSDKAITRMKLLGVDGIITNYPQKFTNKNAKNTKNKE